VDTAAWYPRLVTDVESTLVALVRERARAEGPAWLDAERARIRGGDAGALAVALPAAGRQVGRGGLDAPGATITTASGEVIPLAAWRIDDAARVALLLADAARAPDGAVARALTLYQQGDARERCAVLRALSLLPGAATDDAALPAVFDAMRTSQGEVLEAALCDNPYASRHLPQHEWRKAVLKVAFVGMSLGRVTHVAERADAELAQSLVDLATEREAATRAVPPEIWPIASRFPPPGLAAKLLGYLEHPAVAHRAEAATGLGHMLAASPASRGFLADRLEREKDAVVRDALRAALAS
jgi:hypothetical protein